MLARHPSPRSACRRAVFATAKGGLQACTVQPKSKSARDEWPAFRRARPPPRGLPKRSDARRGLSAAGDEVTKRRSSTTLGRAQARQPRYEVWERSSLSSRWPHQRGGRRRADCRDHLGRTGRDHLGRTARAHLRRSASRLNDGPSAKWETSSGQNDGPINEVGGVERAR